MRNTERVFYAGKALCSGLTRKGGQFGRKFKNVGPFGHLSPQFWSIKIGTLRDSNPRSPASQACNKAKIFSFLRKRNKVALQLSYKKHLT